MNNLKKIIILGNSMAPYLIEGDVLLFEPSTTPPKIGDIVLFRDGSEIVAHRYITQNSAKGDNSRNIDLGVGTQREIIGIANYRFIKPNLKTPLYKAFTNVMAILSIRYLGNSRYRKIYWLLLFPLAKLARIMESHFLKKLVVHPKK